MSKSTDVQGNFCLLESCLRLGVSISLGSGPKGALSGMGLWTDHVDSHEAYMQYWNEYRQRLFQICHILDEGLRGTHLGTFVQLSKRERDCLTYLAIGLRPAEICP